MTLCVSFFAQLRIESVVGCEKVSSEYGHGVEHSVLDSQHHIQLSKSNIKEEQIAIKTTVDTDERSDIRRRPPRASLRHQLKKNHIALSSHWNLVKTSN